MPDNYQYNIDKEFYSMMDSIKSKSIESITEQMLYCFKLLPLQNQAILESYYRKYPYWGTLNVSEHDLGVFVDRAMSLYSHNDDFLWLYNKLSDYRSKSVLSAIVQNWYRFRTLDSIIEKQFSQYFDLDIIKCTENEVFIDVGAYIGDSVLSYLRAYGEGCYKKIYCYEITPSSISRLKNSLSDCRDIVFRELGVSDACENLYISECDDISSNQIADNGSIMVSTTTLDIDLANEPTLIKMDIEGHEERAIKGAAGHIKNSKPKLAIAAYHSNTDIWKLPRLIDSINPGYEFYLRYHGSNLSPSEATLLAK
ncbi:MAG: FkbM family methyltransferase [Eubacteriaceae bacterium]|nr:FkbM family methyltransferase [Eubacteriaceae bacterium]